MSQLSSFQYFSKQKKFVLRSCVKTARRVDRTLPSINTQIEFFLIMLLLQAHHCRFYTHLIKEELSSLPPEILFIQLNSGTIMYVHLSHLRIQCEF